MQILVGQKPQHAMVVIICGEVGRKLCLRPASACQIQDIVKNLWKPSDPQGFSLVTRRCISLFTFGEAVFILFVVILCSEQIGGLL